MFPYGCSSPIHMPGLSWIISWKVSKRICFCAIQAKRFRFDSAVSADASAASICALHLWYWCAKPLRKFLR